MLICNLISAGTVIALQLVCTVPDLVLAKGAITGQNMRIQFLSHDNKLNLGILLHLLRKLLNTLLSHLQAVMGYLSSVIRY